MFTVEERDRARQYMIDLARRDERVVSGAEVGSLSLGGGDRWSDLDLTFGIADGVSLLEVLDNWSGDLVSQLDALHLFDLVAGPAIYRVFLLTDHLQLDVSVTHASKFRPTSPRFKLLFGDAGEPQYPAAPSRQDTLGWAVLWARHARVCIEREHWWQAEYCITHLRYRWTELACLRHELPPSYGKGADRLPEGERVAFEQAIVRSLDLDELRRALSAAITGLIRECELAGDDERVQEHLREMAAQLPE